MAESEASFPDRTQKSQVLHDACIGFTPVYVPMPETITLANYQIQINAASVLNSDVANADANLSDASTRRHDVVLTIKETATHLLAYIKSGPPWKAKYPAAKRLADAIRGMKAPRPPEVTPAPGTELPKRPERGGQSYKEIEGNWDSLVTLAIALPGFAPTNEAIEAGQISALLSSIKALNKEVSLKEGILNEAQKLRVAGFFDKGGMKDRFTEVKDNVKGQYGPSSTQWGQVKGMRW